MADMGAFIADRIVRCHLRTMARLNVDYDLLTWEGDILRLHFWATAFDRLKTRNAIFLQTEGRLWVGTGSDHTDRGLERISVALSKQLCAKVVGPSLWRLDDLLPHWDDLALRSWTHRGGRRDAYQDGTLAAILPPDQLLAKYAAFAEPLSGQGAMFCGTIATIHEIAPADEFEMELHDPVLNRRLTHRYRVVTLPANA